MPYVLGIDIGPATTTAAVARRSGTGWSVPDVVQLGERSRTVPSVLHVTADGNLDVGDPGAAEPGRVARRFGRRVGDDAPLIVGGEPCPPQALTAVLAMWVVERVVAREGESPEHVVVSHPAAYGRHRRALVRQAMADVGLTEVTLLPRPVLAAEGHTASGWTGSVLGVLSVDGDEFEAAVVRWTDPAGFHLLEWAASPDPFGWVDPDEALADLVHERLRAGGDPAGGAATGGSGRRQRGGDRFTPAGLRHECARARDRLTSVTETEVMVPSPTGRVPVPVTRADLAAVARPAVETAVEALAGTAAAVDGRGDRDGRRRERPLDGVLLTGDLAGMPVLTELAAAVLPAPVTAGPGPVAAVGAAVVAGTVTAPAAVAHPAGGGRRSSAVPVRPRPSRADGHERHTADPPPRPPVTVTPLRLVRRAGQRRPGVVGGGR